jgi:uncharacterized protein (TIGR02246 family)
VTAAASNPPTRRIPLFTACRTAASPPLGNGEASNGEESMSEFPVVYAGIQHLHARCVDAAWRKDADAFANCFSQDGEWKIATMHFRGRDDVRAAFARLLGACQRVLILSSPPLIDMGPDGVTSRTYLTEFAKMMDGSSAMTLGAYFDRYVQEDGDWRFRLRHFGLKYRGPSDLSAEIVDSPDYGPPPGMPGAEDPTFTRRSV